MVDRARKEQLRRAAQGDLGVRVAAAQGDAVQQDAVMRRDLSEQHVHEPEQGWLVAPDGRRYFRRSTKTKRREADELIAEGAPLVLYYWAGDQLDWCDGDDARDEWRVVRPSVVTGEPSRKGDIEWTAGRWEDEEGRLLVLLTAHC